MTSERTAPRTRITEQHKARFRLPILALLTIVLPGMIGVRSTAVWVVYAAFVTLYSLWALRLTANYSQDRRLGFLLCLTDAVVLLPLLVWTSDLSLRVLIVLVFGAGMGITYAADRGHAPRKTNALAPDCGQRDQGGRAGALSPQMVLERAVRARLSRFTIDGSRFCLVVLRVLRYDEAVAYYGSESAARMLAAVGRRGARHLGPEADLFSLGHGRVAFLFEVEDAPSRSRALSGDWNEPYDVEGMAMRLGRKTCEHLIEGRRVECVVGWASAPADGLNADDLLYAAENGTRSTEAFRRVSGSRLAVRVVPSSGSGSRRVAAAVPDEARTAVG